MPKYQGDEYGVCDKCGDCLCRVFVILIPTTAEYDMAAVTQSANIMTCVFSGIGRNINMPCIAIAA